MPHAMAPNIHPSSANAGSDDAISRIYLIRHGDRFDYANPSWSESARDHGALVTDPPLSALGHRQAREAADQLRKITKTDDGEGGGGVDSRHHVDEILVSPYLRVIQTACPTSDALGLQLPLEEGLSESHATPGGVLPSSAQRFAYFPQVDPRHSSLLNVEVTPGHACKRTGFPCEAFAGEYCRRMGRFATCLERTYRGRSVVLFSHAASVAALLKCSMRTFKFAPCGIYHLERKNDGPWRLVRNGGSNEGYVAENSPTTYPWGYGEKYFEEGNGGNYSGSLEGIGLDYFVPKESET